MMETAPTGWLSCDGGLYNVEEYEDLYTELVKLPSTTRTTWGSADWTTQFNVPNLQVNS